MEWRTATSDTAAAPPSHHACVVFLNSILPMLSFVSISLLSVQTLCSPKAQFPARIPSERSLTVRGVGLGGDWALSINRELGRNTCLVIGLGR